MLTHLLKNSEKKTVGQIWKKWFYIVIFWMPEKNPRELKLIDRYLSPDQARKKSARVNKKRREPSAI